MRHDATMSEQQTAAYPRSPDRQVTGEWVDPTAEVWERETQRAADAEREQQQQPEQPPTEG